VKKTFIHPYIPNSVPLTKKEMMAEIGLTDLDELLKDLPVRSGNLNLPGPMTECELRRHIQGILAKNRGDLLVFCGAGCWPHYVPAVVDEIINRTEFKTAYLGAPEPEKGKMQALFEYQSLMAELIGLDVVNNSVYDWASAAGEAANMARRLTGKNQILAPANISPERLAVIRTYCESSGGTVISVAFNRQSGALDLNDLEEKISTGTAAVYIENPTYLGVIEDQVEDIAELTRQNDAVFVVGVDASSLGILRPPGEYGADIVVGEAQPLGLHMNYGGNFLGIFGCRDDPAYLDQLPGYIAAICPTVDGKSRGYLDTLWERRHFFYQRENATSLIGSSSNLCAIAAAVFMSLLGPLGMVDLGEAIVAKTTFAIKRISPIKGITTPLFSGVHFKEFVVNFDGLGTDVGAVNKVLLNQYGILGGQDLTTAYPELGQSALFCVTEAHSLEDIERLVSALEEIATKGDGDVQTG
jgi:glycine dehydrogenase subunit 1